MIRYLDANHPGSSHDSFVWNGSSLNQLLLQRYNNGERSSWLLGNKLVIEYIEMDTKLSNRNAQRK